MENMTKVKDQCHNISTNDKVNADTLIVLQQQNGDDAIVIVNNLSNSTCDIKCKDDKINETSEILLENLRDNNGKMIYHINMLPDEMLEFILTYLPPYKDLENSSLVCKRWHEIVKSKYTTKFKTYLFHSYKYFN